MAEMNRFLRSTAMSIWMAALLLLLKRGGAGAARLRSVDGKGGTWEVLLNNAGVVAMHVALTYRGTVVMYDQTTGRSGYRVRRGHHGSRLCDGDSTSSQCWAHSVEYHIGTNSIRPLSFKTNAWCSSGSFLSNGTILQTGGFNKGARRIRYFRPCSNERCNWVEESKAILSNRRWYASNHILPEKDRVIVVGGLNSFTYEFVPKTSHREGVYELPLLRHTHDRTEGGSNLYPFVHLSSDGNLFIFANRDSILFNYKNGKVVKTFPQIPGNGSRSYPSTASSIMLPLNHADDFHKVEIMICGGAARGAYSAARSGHFVEGLRSCGRMVITSRRPEWSMEDMPGPRLLSSMLILPTGQVLIINGAKRGCAGWNNARDPSLEPYLYKPKNREGKRFSILNPTKIPRLYHSTAIVLPDGRVLVGGSNPNRLYTFTGVEYPTELRLQAFTPYYMGHFFHNRRASNLSIIYHRGDNGVAYGEEFRVVFNLARRPSKLVEFNAYAPPFETHSVSMGQRMMRLKCKSMVRRNGGEVTATVIAPPSPIVAPSGYYLLTVVNGGIPSKAHWIRFIHHE